jgi:hypothetical protein
MEQHAYWIVNCQTSGCRPMFVKYIGKHDGRDTYSIPFDAPEQFTRYCEVCSRTHTYKRDELKPYLWIAAPAPGFLPAF